MPWFKVDDGLASKVETTRIPRSSRPAAMGLWVLAGSWSAQQLTDGHIPMHMLDELAGTQESADWLVLAGYWEVLPDGWRFAGWEGQQPMREQTLERRRKNTEKVSSWRARNPVTTKVADRVTNSPETLPPTQPVRKEHVQRDAHDFSSDFSEWWAMFPRKQGKADAEKAYAAARQTNDAKILLDGAQAYALLSIEVEKKFLKLPAGWLRGERWNDDPIPMGSSATERRSSPAERATQTLSLGAQTDDPTYCPDHPGYPVKSWEPCAACARELPEGADF